jgi:hypothetical protein
MAADGQQAGPEAGIESAVLPPTELMPPGPAPAAEEALTGPGSSEIVAPPPASRAPRGGGWLLPVLAIYSIVATLFMLAMVAVAIMARQMQDDLLERLPDDGEHPGASRSQQKPGPKRIDFKTMPKHELPDRLRVPLGKPITVGDLKLTPQKVELRRIKVRTQGYADAAEGADDSLVLTLELENVSPDVLFRPMDPCFTRKWQGSFESGMPFTYLQVGSQRFYGGPCEWPIRSGAHQEKVEGQDFDRVLGPGEKMTTFICTNPDDHAGGALAAYRGTLVYRIRFRRGLVPLLHGGEASATAVIGVVFTSADIEHGQAASAAGPRRNRDRGTAQLQSASSVSA